MEVVVMVLWRERLWISLSPKVCKTPQMWNFFHYRISLGFQPSLLTAGPPQFQDKAEALLTCFLGSALPLLLGLTPQTPWKALDMWFGMSQVGKWNGPDVSPSLRLSSRSILSLLENKLFKRFTLKWPSDLLWPVTSLGLAAKDNQCFRTAGAELRAARLAKKPWGLGEGGGLGVRANAWKACSVCDCQH